MTDARRVPAAWAAWSFALLLGSTAAAPTPKPTGNLAPGTYRQIDTVTKKPLVPGNQIVVVAAKGGRLAFSLNAVRQTDAGLGFVVGLIPATLPVTWTQDAAAGKCRLTFDPVPRGLRIVQDAAYGDCGFGSAINASGTYLPAPENAP